MQKFKCFIPETKKIWILEKTLREGFYPHRNFHQNEKIAITSFNMVRMTWLCLSGQFFGWFWGVFFLDFFYFVKYFFSENSFS